MNDAAILEMETTFEERELIATWIAKGEFKYQEAIPKLLRDFDRLLAARPSVVDDDAEARIVHNIGFNAGVAVTKAQFAAVLTQAIAALEQAGRDLNSDDGYSTPEYITDAIALLQRTARR